MEAIRWGIIGTGSIASTFAAALSSMENVELTAVASRSQNRAKEFADRFHIKKAYGRYEELVKDSDIDVIYIGTPHTEHKENAALCIKNGKAVLCEKPFTLNRKETEYLISLAKEHHVFLMEAMWTKFLPVTQTVKGWLKEKRIGEVRNFDVSFGFCSEFDINKRLFNPKLGGGALLDVGVYSITYVINMMDKLPDQVISIADLGQSGVDEQNEILFRYKDGVLASLRSAVSVNIGSSAIITGTKGKILVPDFWGANRAELYDQDGNLSEVFKKTYDPNGYIYEAAEVNRCLLEGKKESEVNPLQDTLDVIKIMDIIRAQWGLRYPQEI